MNDKSAPRSSRASRRAWLRLTSGGGFLGLAGTGGGVLAAARAQPYGRVDLPAGAMELARRMREQALAAGDRGYGAVVVKDGEVVGLGASQVVSAADPTAHAEMEAIRDAARRLGSADLSGCVLYSTSAPCRMCEAAAYWARVSGLSQRDDSTETTAPRYSDCG